MSARLETARDLALRMPERWQVAPGPRWLGAPDGVSALHIDARPAEVTTPASDAHILSYIKRGESHHRLWYDGHSITDGILRDRCVTLVPAGVTPRAVMTGPISLVHVYLPHCFISKKAAELGWRNGAGALEIINPDYRPDEPLIMLLECLSMALPSLDMVGRLYADSLASAIALRVLQRWSNLPAAGSPPASGGLAPWQLRRACDMMEAHLDQDIGLDTLASVAGLSPTHFSRAFKQSTGVPPFRWLLQRRVERAKMFLLDEDTPLAEIALAVGFSAQPQFTTAFRRVTGRTPGAWRRERLF